MWSLICWGAHNWRLPVLLNELVSEYGNKKYTIKLIHILISFTFTRQHIISKAFKCRISKNGNLEYSTEVKEKKYCKLIFLKVIIWGLLSMKWKYLDSKETVQTLETEAIIKLIHDRKKNPWQTSCGSIHVQVQNFEQSKPKEKLKGFMWWCNLCHKHSG